MYCTFLYILANFNIVTYISYFLLLTQLIGFFLYLLGLLI